MRSSLLPLHAGKKSVQSVEGRYSAGDAFVPVRERDVRVCEVAVSAAEGKVPVRESSIPAG